MNTVGGAFMYEVLCTCITAPLEGLLVDKAKYSENVGHHLVVGFLQSGGMGKEDAYQNKSAATRTTKSNENRRLQRHTSADPTRLGGKNNKAAPKIPNAAYLNWWPPSANPGPLMLGFPPCKFERSQIEYRDPYVAPILG